MDKRVMLAVAGSGKTSYLVNSLTTNKRFLILTYTINNKENIEKAVAAKFGCIPSNIKIDTYFTFLYWFCYKPFLAADVPSEGIYWDRPPESSKYKGLTHIDFYVLNRKWLYYNRISKLLIEKKIINDINKRLAKYYDFFFIDEVQDFAGHDFSFLEHITRAETNMLFVGDFFQHTFDTSNDGKVNENLHDDVNSYRERFNKLNITIDSTTLIESHRCSKTVCEFIKERIAIKIEAKADSETLVRFIDQESEADAIFNDQKIVKLFYQEHSCYPCLSANWGGSKGLEFQDVCVVLNDTTLKHYTKNTLSQLKAKTKNKFYVACTRTKNNLYFVSQKIYEKHKTQL
jgi:DNA helicase-2/ATP-dependent DNA helicase PcrA